MSCPSLWLWGIHRTWFALQELSALRSLHLRKKIFWSLLCANGQLWLNSWVIQQKIVTSLKGPVSDPSLFPRTAVYSCARSQHLQCHDNPSSFVFSIGVSWRQAIAHFCGTLRGEENALQTAPRKQTTAKQSQHTAPCPPSGLLPPQYATRRALPGSDCGWQDKATAELGVWVGNWQF